MAYNRPMLSIFHANITTIYLIILGEYAHFPDWTGAWFVFDKLWWFR